MLCRLVLATPEAAAQPSSRSLRSAIHLTDRAELRRSRNRVSEALKDYHDALVLYPGYPQALLGLSQLRAQMGDVKEATKALQAVLSGVQADDSARAAAHRELARMRHLAEATRTSHLQSAVRIYRRLAAHKANTPELLEQLQTRYLRSRSYAAALLTARALQVLAPNEDRETTISALRILANTTDTLSAGHPGADPTRRAIERLSRRY